MATVLPLSEQAIITKSNVEVRDDILRVIKNGIVQFGVSSNPNIQVESDFGLVATGLGNECGVLHLNLQIMGQQLMPDSAVSASLDRILSDYGFTRRPASSAVGSVIVTTSNPQFVAAGTQLQFNGIRYKVLVGGTYGNNQLIVVQAVDTGSKTNRLAGDVLQWVQTPAYFAPTAVVSVNQPISGGVEKEDDPTARNRLQQFWSTPPSGGAPAQYSFYAQQSDSSVQFGFVYPCARADGTVDVSVTTYATTDSSLRNVDPTILKNKIQPFITANGVLGSDGYTSTVNNYPINVSVKLSLPNAPNAAAPGPGGGWLDSAPLQITTSKPAIRVVDGYAISGNNSGVPQNTSTQFWVDFPVAPDDNTVYSVSYFSSATLEVTNAQTSGTYLPATNYPSLSTHTSLYYVTVNTPFYNNGTSPIEPGEWIFPTAERTSTYIEAILTYMASMGPGERTSNPGLLPRAFRVPLETSQFPYKLNSRFLKPIISTGPEVDDALFAFRGVYTNGMSQTPIPNGSSITDSTNFTDYGSITTNSDPAYPVYAPPTAYLANGTALGNAYIFVPGNLGIYPDAF